MCASVMMTIAALIVMHPISSLTPFLFLYLLSSFLKNFGNKKDGVAQTHENTISERIKKIASKTKIRY